jgi:hypothetical protein
MQSRVESLIARDDGAKGRGVGGLKHGAGKVVDSDDCRPGAGCTRHMRATALWLSTPGCTLPPCHGCVAALDATPYPRLMPEAMIMIMIMRYLTIASGINQTPTRARLCNVCRYYISDIRI